MQFEKTKTKKIKKKSKMSHVSYFFENCIDVFLFDNSKDNELILNINVEKSNVCPKIIRKKNDKQSQKTADAS